MKYYEAITINKGKKEVVHIRGENKNEATSMIIATFGGTIIRIKEVPMPLDVALLDMKDKIQTTLFKERLNPKEFSIFLRQIAVMVNAGIPLREAIFESMSASKNTLIKKIGTSVVEDVDSGLSLTEAFKKFEDLIGNIAISMIELGEKTGSLAESIHKLVEILEDIEDNKMKVKKGMRMPIITLFAMAIAFIVLILVVIPKFKSIFDKFGGELPLPTRMLMNLEWFLSNYGLYVLGVLAVAAWFFSKAYRQNVNLRLKVDFFVLKTYLLGEIASLGMYSRYMMILSELIKSGIPLDEALQTSQMTLGNSFIVEQLGTVPVSIQRGTELSEAFEKTALFESMVISMVRSGESGGELDKMLSEVAKYYKSRFQNMIDNIATLIEPLMMGIIAVLVLVLALGIFLPMWELSSVAIK